MTAQPGATPPPPRHSSDPHASEQRRPIGSCETYSEAERAAGPLPENDFPIERVAMLVEQVVGRLNYSGAALRGAGSGTVAGLLIGWLFGTFDWLTPLPAAFTLAVYGLTIGAIFGHVVHALQRGRRDFASVRVTTPTRYEIVADDAVADETKNLLAKMTGSV